jgi:heme/copper-type cytochrome/quinol oxidase subunit 2
MPFQTYVLIVVGGIVTAACFIYRRNREDEEQDNEDVEGQKIVEAGEGV